MLLYVPKGRENVISRNSGGVQSTPQHSSVKYLFSVLCFQHTGKKKPGCGQGWPLLQCTAASARAKNCAQLQLVRGADGWCSIPAFQLKSYGQEGTTRHPLVPRSSKPRFRLTSKYNV